MEMTSADFGAPPTTVGAQTLVESPTPSRIIYCMGNSKADETCDYILEELLDYGAILSFITSNTFFIRSDSKFLRWSVRMFSGTPCREIASFTNS